MKTIYSRTGHIVCIVCIACIVFVPRITRAQVTDDFSDGNFTTNPKWTGDTTQFEINPALQLQLHSSGSDTSVLLTRSSRIKNTEWDFWMKLSFNTSANNHARVYLVSDTSDFNSQMNGYYLQAGGGDDSLFIIKQTGVISEKKYHFKCYKTFHTTNILRFKITCDDIWQWMVMIDTAGGYNYYKDGTFSDSTTMSARWFGLYCRYTSSNAAKIWFDDFYVGKIIRDTIPPGILAQEVLTDHTIRVSFTEPLQKQNAENNANYLLTPIGGRPDSAILDTHHPSEVNLFFHQPLTEGAIDTLHIDKLQDLSGNQLPDTAVPVCYYRPKAYDILLYEIMADPDPPVELPNGEFVELFNRTKSPINLKDWSFTYSSYTKIFPSIAIQPGGYLLVVKDSSWLNIAPCVLLFTSSTSLSNEGTTIVLRDSRDHVIHSVTYSPDWYRGSFKGEGGWSLEMIDPLNPCGCIENWGSAINSLGGTPGQSNSISISNPDLTAPVPERAVILDSAILEVYFSEGMDSVSLFSPGNWVITDPDGVYHPVGVEPVSPEYTSVKLIFDMQFTKGTLYTLRLMGEIKDCAGNIVDSTGKIQFAIPDSAAAHDIVINEILSNPASGGARFIELFNRSEKIIDLQSLVIANRDTPTEIQSNAVPVFTTGFLLFPGDYIAITSNQADILHRYRSPVPEHVLTMAGFPVFGDDTGTVVLARKDNLSIIDKIRYDPTMHYPLLVTTEGVSLERTNPDLPSDYKDNWHSAAETAGFATPAYANSHMIMPDEEDREILLEPGVFSPDNDGHDDLLSIIIRENEPDIEINIVIYDAKGRMVRQLVNNVLLGSEGVFFWDGMTSGRNKAPLGFYVILVELTRPDGKVKHIKKTAILGGKL